MQNHTERNPEAQPARPTAGKPEWQRPVTTVVTVDKVTLQCDGGSFESGSSTS